MNTKSKPRASGEFYTPKEIIRLMEKIFEREAPDSIQAEQKGMKK